MAKDAIAAKVFKKQKRKNLGFPELLQPASWSLEQL
jgi:hypothetical protein